VGIAIISLALTFRSSLRLIVLTVGSALWTWLLKITGSSFYDASMKVNRRALAELPEQREWTIREVRTELEEIENPVFKHSEKKLGREKSRAGWRSMV
jgi:hypothetical protein